MSHINEGYIEEYIRDITPKNPAYLREMEDFAEENHIPIIEAESAQFLKLQLKIHQPKRILEIGTAIGYSSLIMSEALAGDCKITTIERRDDMIEMAINYIGKTPYEKNINILKGEAQEVLADLKDEYDLIFMDAAKGQYLEFFNQSIRLLKPGGLIISDNVLFKGMVATDELVIRRKITIVKRLRKFLKYINEIEGFTSCVIPIGDGMALTYREV